MHSQIDQVVPECLMCVPWQEHFFSSGQSIQPEQIFGSYHTMDDSRDLERQAGVSGLQVGSRAERDEQTRRIASEKARRCVVHGTRRRILSSHHALRHAGVKDTIRRSLMYWRGIRCCGMNRREDLLERSLTGPCFMGACCTH